MTISRAVAELMEGASWIRRMFEEGIRLKQRLGADQVADLSLGNPANVILWLKRSARYFPYIEAELRRAGLPDDLKYVAVVESALLPRALS